MSAALTLCGATVAQALARAGWQPGEPLPTWLSAAEQARALAIKSPDRLAAFLAGRWLLRKAAARHTGIAPGWQATAGEGGPPRLHHPGGAELHAGLSHSGRFVAAVVGQHPAGIDIEDRRVSRDRDWPRLAPRMLHPVEQAWLAQQPDAAAACLTLWTLKEAAIKLRGQALGLRRLPCIVCQPGPAQVHKPTAIPATVWSTPDWVLSLATDAGQPPQALALHGLVPAIDPPAAAQPWTVRHEG